ncbi:MAG: gas vesicle protein [Candidatus Dormibacteraeota bacterium]|nr:gas vesicle protein [Candidatus Dormibacteraeota bacterium]
MAITPNAQTPAIEATNSQAHSGSLADVLDVILDKGLVIDAFVRVSLVGIEILTLDARIVVASVDTYMHFAREAHRLEMGGGKGSAKQGLAGMMGKLEEGGAHSITRGALKGAGEGLKEGLLPDRRQSQARGEGGIVQRAISSVKEKAVDSIRDAMGSDNGEDDNEQDTEHVADEGSGGGAPASTRSRQQGGSPRGSSQRPGGRSPGESTQQGGPESRARGSSRRTTPRSRRAPPRDRPAS